MLVRVRVYNGRERIQDETIVYERDALKWLRHTVRLTEVSTDGFMERERKLRVRFDFDPPLTVPQPEEDE
jgi:hypothetical protein